VGISLWFWKKSTATYGRKQVETSNRFQTPALAKNHRSE
jgi:hypothetical protein